MSTVFTSLINWTVWLESRVRTSSKSRLNGKLRRPRFDATELHHRLLSMRNRLDSDNKPAHATRVIYS